MLIEHRGAGNRGRAHGLAALLALVGSLLAARADAQVAVQQGIGSSAGLQIRWERPSGVQGHPGSATTGQPGVMGYIIYRQDMTGGGPVIAVGGTLNDNRSFRDTAFVVHDVPNVFSGREPGTDPGPLETLEDVPGLIPGHVYRYQVQCAFFSTQDWNGDGVPDNVAILSPPSGPSNGVTAILPGVILSPAYGETAEVTNLTVRFATTPGASNYQVFVSSDLRFKAGSTVRCPAVQFVPPDRGGPIEATVSCDVSRLMQPRRGRRGRQPTQLFVTVLAWAIGDPRPIPYGGISYPAVAVVPVVGPPPPP